MLLLIHYYTVLHVRRKEPLIMEGMGSKIWRPISVTVALSLTEYGSKQRVWGM